MVDSRFFTQAGNVTLEEIIALTGAEIHAAKSDNASKIFSNVSPLDRAGPNEIGFLDNTKYVDSFASSKAGACFVREKFASRAPETMTLLITEEPYYCYALTARKFYPDPHFEPTCASGADIDPSAQIAPSSRIDTGAVIGAHVKIGEHVWIGANAVLGDYVEIGSYSRVGACSTVSHAIIGERVLIHRGVHIGQDGFGFAAGSKGLVKVPQLGRVMIHNDVEIGSGTCIDRGTGPDTIIGQGSKIDNLVQIGHNVQLGRSVIIAAQVGISGSTHIGDGAMLGGQVGLAGHLKIGSGAKIAAQAGIMSDIPPAAAIGGSPGVAIKDWHRQTIALAKLARRKDNA